MLLPPEIPCSLHLTSYSNRARTHTGGSSMYPGLPTRLEKDIKDRYLKEVLKGE